MIVNVTIFCQLKDFSIDAIVEISRTFLEPALCVKIDLLSDVGLILHVAPHQSILIIYELLKLGCRLDSPEYLYALREGKLHCKKTRK